MADLIDEIQELKLETIKGANESIEAGNLAAAQIQAQNATTNSIDILTETFKQFFKAERRDKESDDLEASREAQGQVTKEGAMGAATGSDIEPLDFGGSYLLGIIFSLIVTWIIPRIWKTLKLAS